MSALTLIVQALTAGLTIGLALLLMAYYATQSGRK